MKPEPSIRNQANPDTKLRGSHGVRQIAACHALPASLARTRPAGGGGVVAYRLVIRVRSVGRRAGRVEVHLVPTVRGEQAVRVLGGPAPYTFMIIRLPNGRGCLLALGFCLDVRPRRTQRSLRRAHVRTCGGIYASPACALVAAV